jgi:hypothetical protein
VFSANSTEYNLYRSFSYLNDRLSYIVLGCIDHDEVVEVIDDIGEEILDLYWILF